MSSCRFSVISVVYLALFGRVLYCLFIFLAVLQDNFPKQYSPNNLKLLREKNLVFFDGGIKGIVRLKEDLSTFLEVLFTAFYRKASESSQNIGTSDESNLTQYLIVQKNPI